MADSNEPRAFARGFDRANRPPTRSWSLNVVDAFDVSPRMRRVRFSGADLGEMEWRPGQDLVLSLPANGEIARRHYTIATRDDKTMEIDFVLHGVSPATNWARNARGGSIIEAAGPRGRTRINPEAPHHYFLGDETALPGIFAMAESLPADANATILMEVADEKEKRALHAAAKVHIEWIFRNTPAAPNDLLLNALQRLAPSADGAHAYLLAETSKVRAMRHWLTERGFVREQITAEGYWRPGRVGGHDHA